MAQNKYQKELSNRWSKAHFDKTFLILICLITVVGFFIFISASLGLQARNSAPTIKLIVNQLVFGVLGGAIAGYLAYNIPLGWLKRHAVGIFVFAVLLTLCVFIPGIGFSYGGATRWLDIGPLSFQPAEILKIAAVIITAAWYSFINKRIDDIKLGLGGLIGIITVACGILLLQPDTGTAIVIVAAVGSVYLVAGGKWRHILALSLVSVLALVILISFRPYVKDRLVTFINPTADPLGDGYQTKQSLIAVGSGGVIGRGPGQSIQKFNYLPEPVGDSIFAVFAEEYGFIGSLLLLTIYCLIGYRGLMIAHYLKPGFTKLIVVGLVTMIIIQSILNIGAMVGVFPLSGMPLIFVSHGGTALMFSLVAVGIILRASTNIPKRLRNHRIW